MEFSRQYLLVSSLRGLGQLLQQVQFQSQTTEYQTHTESAESLYKTTICTLNNNFTSAIFPTTKLDHAVKRPSLLISCKKHLAKMASLDIWFCVSFLPP